ncbi:hypothetical protein GDO86_001523 [Hymenochirus boettgeri]|uniref:Cyclin-dependent kinases regulatory subunit n=1 Tax=Hymenochirus boettgeri TaxID=247094 RepID=A0A8T2KG20_9PIPI|nr:hypothetical protein GDO86_001523 [Hymenochirus boettgeri]
MSFKNTTYSDKYTDEHIEYRSWQASSKTHLMSEDEWRRLGVQQSLGWVHYMIHEPATILLFRRPLPKDQQK